MVKSQYHDMFYTESRELVAALGKCLVDLEKNPSDQECLHEIFRHAHTLKGIAASMEYDAIVEFAHEAESALDLLRQHKLKVDASVIDLLLEAVDHLELLIEREKDQISSPLPPDAATRADVLSERFRQLREPMSSSANVESDPGRTPSPLIRELALQWAQETPGAVAFLVRVRLADDCELKMPRALVILQEALECGRIPGYENLQTWLKRSEFGSRFEFFLITTASEQEVVKDLSAMAEVESVVLQTITGAAETNGDATPAAKIPKATNGVETPMVRVALQNLDDMMNLVGELIINRIRLTNIAAELDSAALRETLAQLDRLTDELQQDVMSIRLIPTDVVLNRFPRMVRALAAENGKQVDLVIEGAEIGLDRTILDEINEPLIHLLRNAVGHGIEDPEDRLRAGKPETGTIRLTVRRESSHVAIEVSDDGRGIDPDEVRRHILANGILPADTLAKMSAEETLMLITLPGFSTRKEADRVSGRGVGMNVVRTKVESFGGALRVESTLGEGSRFLLKLPITMAVVRALLIGVGDETFAVPLLNISETTRVQSEHIRRIDGQTVVPYRDTVLPLLYMGAEFGYRSQSQEDLTEGDLSVVVVEAGTRKVGLVVDRFLHQQEVVIKTLKAPLRGMKGIAGATILGDGKVGLIMDVMSLT